MTNSFHDNFSMRDVASKRKNFIKSKKGIEYEVSLIFSSYKAYKHR